VIPGQADVRGSLDKEIIRRIIRRHINEVRHCYQQELITSPGLGGRVLIQFTIATSGQVASSLLQSSTIANPRVEDCIVRAVRRWEFPKPHGDTVTVSYPFVLTPTADQPEARMAGEAPAAPTPVDETLALLAQVPMVIRIEWISARLGYHGVSDPVVLAWMIRRRPGGLQTRLLVARLLDTAQRRHDAVRVLSEAARAEPDAVAGELRRMGADADAAEVLALKQR
jgi:TonB family protein